MKDTKGEPLIGVNVKVKGTTTGAITDFDGNFQIQAKRERYWRSLILDMLLKR